MCGPQHLKIWCMVYLGAWCTLLLGAKCLCAGYTKKSLKKRRIHEQVTQREGITYTEKSLGKRRIHETVTRKASSMRKSPSNGVGYTKQRLKRRRIRHNDSLLWCVGVLCLVRLSVLWCLGAWCMLVLVLAWCAALHQHQD